MSENKTPVVRRGIASARGTQRLKFTHSDANRACGLFEAHLENVDVSMIKIGEDRTGMPSFNGLEIPKIRFTFESNHAEPTKRKLVSISFNAVESTIDTIPGKKESWKVDSVFDWFKHILDVYVLKGRELTEEEASALTLPFADFDENGEYVSVDPETVIAGWKAVFENVANILNAGKEGKSYYKRDGKFIPVWIKLLRCVKNPKKGWQNIQSNGDLSFPTFVGEGCIEIIVPNQAPSIHINTIRESIVPKVQDTPKAPTTLGGIPGVPAAPIAAMPSFGGGIPDVAIGGGNEPFGEIPTDMPDFM